MSEPPYEDAPENHWSRWVDPESDDYVPPQRCFPIPCPPLEDVRLEVLEVWGPAAGVTGCVGPGTWD